MATTQLTKTFTSYSNPYKLIVDLSSTSTIASNSSTVKAVVKLYCPYSLTIYGRSNSITINGKKYTFSSPAISSSGGTTHTLGTITTDAITHNSDGTKSVAVSCVFNIQATISGTYYSSISLSGTFTLDKIPRAATITSAPNFTDEDNPTVKYSNPAGNAVSNLDIGISFSGTDAVVQYRAVSKTGTSYTFELTDEERQFLRAGTTGGTSRTVYFYLRTKMSGETYYNKLGKTFTVINCAPLINVADVIDTNEESVILTGNANTQIRGYSNTKYTINAEAVKNSALTKYEATVGGKTYTGQTGYIDDIADGKMEFTVYDSRNMWSKLTQTVKVINYQKPTISLKVDMPTTDGETTVYLDGVCWVGNFGVVRNGINIQYKYVSDSGEDSGWVQIAEPTTNSYKVEIPITGLNYRSTYTFTARIFDVLNSVDSNEIVVRTTPVFDWGKEDFNFNVPIGLNGNTIIRDNVDSGNLVIAANGGSIYLRPNGADETNGEVCITSSGKILLGNYTLPYISTGSAKINYGTNANTLDINFDIEYATKPTVIVQQVFDSANITVRPSAVSTTGFTATLQGGFASSGSREFSWVAIGTIKV